jgi:hypothetical protein
MIDLGDQGLAALDSIDVPTDIVELSLSHNKLTTLPDSFFRRRPKIWRLDFWFNLLTDVSFLKCYGSLGYLDLRKSSLAFDELLDIGHIYIAHLRLEGNVFTKYTNTYPLTLPVILDRVWVIDGQFISDFIRKQARAFRETLAFGETVLRCRRNHTTLSPQTGVSQAANHFLAGDSIKLQRLLLLRIVDVARPAGDVKDGLWRALGAGRFIETGEIPLRGSTPRLLLCAFLERVPDHKCRSRSIYM